LSKKLRPTWRDVPVKELHGREKLAFALDRFDVDVTDRVAFDCGAAAGGFTRALLGAGAARVHAVDAGFGQLLGSLRQDPRVVNLERTNLADARVDEPIDVVTLDLSYLSIASALPQLRVDLAPGADLLALVKPVFELQLAGLPDEPFGPLIDAIVAAGQGATAAGWTVVAAAGSPVRGHNGAVEGFLYARRQR
jgi:23S rRNA (cytidine1920-2'-O)/16S rRNA (cytidine1409-2'-O)-methyltransferase